MVRHPSRKSTGQTLEEWELRADEYDGRCVGLKSRHADQDERNDGTGGKKKKMEDEDWHHLRPISYIPL